MGKSKKIIAFTMVLTFLLGAQAMGVGFNRIWTDITNGDVQKNHSGVTLEKIDAVSLNADYLSVENRVLKPESRQIIKVGLGADLTKVTEVSLGYQLDGSEKVLTQDTEDIKNGYITFDYNIPSDTPEGKYNLDSLELKTKDGAVLNNVDLKKIGASYTVSADGTKAASADENKTAEASATSSAGSAAKSGSSSAVLTVDKDSAITAADIGAAIASSKKAMQNETGISSDQAAKDSNTVNAATSNVTIMLDPGHGGTESGAAYNGLVEKNLNLKIAKYAKEELETYEGVTVGMTRTTDVNVDLVARTQLAADQKADIFVSLHNNASGYGTTSGAEVYVSVLKAYHDASAVLGNIILDQLSTLGIADRGVKARASENGTIFELTGELADYYSVIRNSALRGFPGIIIEHCYMDNASDAQKYLSSDSKLKALGVADATALAQYYGLKKKGDSDIGNVALKTTPTTSAEFSNTAYATDGDRSSSERYADSSSTGLQWMQLDLGASYNVGEIDLWHYFGDARKYHDVIVQLSNDPTFTSGVTTVYNNDTDNSAGLGLGKDSEYTETSAGKSICFSTVNARYVRLYSNGSTANGWNHYVEVKAIMQPEGNLAAGKAVTTSSSFTNTAFALDGDKNTDNYANGSNTGLQWFQVDMGESYDVNNINLWHYFGDARKYRDVIVQLSNDPTFDTGITTVYNNDTDNSAGFGKGTDSEYTETSSGKNITFNTVKARYARFYSNGSNINGWNHYVEIEISRDGAQQPVVNLASGKTVTSSSAFIDLYMASDKDTNTERYANSVSAGLQWVQVDLGTSQDVNQVNLWHYFSGGRKYKDVIVQLSNDPTFTKDITTVFNNDTDNSAGLGAGKNSEYAETSAGKSIAFSTVNARYVRLYSNGSNINGWNHYVEIEVCRNSSVSSAITSSSAFTDTGLIKDGSRDTDSYSNGQAGVQWIQMDLGAAKDVNEINLWHYFGDGRKYRDVVVQLSNDPTFATGVKTVFNNDSDNSAGRGYGKDSEYAETSAGKKITFNTANARYVRFYSNGSSANAWNHYVEAEVCNNLAEGKSISTSQSFTDMNYISDGVKDTDEYANGLKSGLQWVQADLGASKNVSEINLWHYFRDARKYRDVVVQLSNDPTFTTDVITVFNNDSDNSAGLGVGSDSEYAEKSTGKIITFGTVNARYVRFYSNGSNVNGWNHYVEFEIYGN